MTGEKPLASNSARAGQETLVDREQRLVQVPFALRSETPAAQLLGRGLSEFLAPLSHGFIGQDDAAFGHELLNIPIARAKARAQPDPMSDDLGREPMALVGMRGSLRMHAASMPHETRAGKVGKFM
jgi:hypothetical protein